MRDRRVRAVFVGLILAFPFLMAATSGRPAQGLRTGLTVLGVEVVLAGGLLTAARERRLLLGERASASASAAGVAPSIPHVRASGRRAQVRASAR